MVHANPFSELYMTEGIAAARFAQLFSPVLAKQSRAHTLFQPGNIVLVGLQGSGKTALLNLMRPDVMISYRALGNNSWPLPKEISRFISAGINLNSSKARDFGQRIVSVTGDNIGTYALLFGDFVNYWIADDLFNNIELIWKDTKTGLHRELQINGDGALLDRFAAKLSKHPCWFGALRGIRTYAELREKIENRIYAYRSFLNYNSELPNSIISSKTSAGEPIAVIADSLKAGGILPSDIPVLIRIDQFEDLMGIERDALDNTGTAFRQIVMKMISERDHRVSYRVGARPYALYPDLQVFRAGTPAEEMRNFSVLDIGDLLVGREARRGLFAEFCRDVFRRRLGIEQDFSADPLKLVFGRGESPEEKARRYARTNRTNVISPQVGFNEKHLELLRGIANSDPLSARLGQGWLLQRLGRKGVAVRFHELETEPWNSPSRKWWKKERIQQALLQIAASQRQKMMWYGSADILVLSGRNILVFLSLCQFIWAEYLRSLNDHQEGIPEGISPITQDIGVHETSRYWYRKVKADPGGGDDRYRFIRIVGSDLRNGLRDDRKMSYPGANGFSLPDADMERHPEIEDFLNRCVAYGVLEWFRHTPKTKSRGQSKKWYLFPILTPYFQLPTPRIKEPKYIRISLVQKWLTSAREYIEKRPDAIQSRVPHPPESGGQLSIDLDSD